MRLALAELRRRPSRFVAAGHPDADRHAPHVPRRPARRVDRRLDRRHRAQRADLIVYSSTAEHSLPRSRIAPEERATGRGGRRGGGGRRPRLAQLGARRARQRGPATCAVALFGYELAPEGVPDDRPGRARWSRTAAWRRRAWRRATTLAARPRPDARSRWSASSTTQVLGAGQPVGVARHVADSHGRQPTRPGVAGDVFQALVVRTGRPGRRPDAWPAIDEATGGATETLTLAAAVEAMPGVSEQRLDLQPDHRGHGHRRRGRGRPVLRPDHRRAHRPLRRPQGRRRRPDALFARRACSRRWS